MGTPSITVVVIGNGIITRVQILDEAICISLHTNSVGKGVNPSILIKPPIFLEGNRADCKSLVRQPVLEKEHSLDKYIFL